MSIYPNNLKNWEFGKEASQNFCPERVTIAERQGTSEDENSETAKTRRRSSGPSQCKAGEVPLRHELVPTRPKTNFSSCLGIASLSSLDWMTRLDLSADQQLLTDWTAVFQQKADASSAELEKRAALLEQRWTEERDEVGAAWDRAEQQGAQLQSAFDASEGRRLQALDHAADELKTFERGFVANRENLQREIDRVDAEEERGLSVLRERVDEWENGDLASIDQLIAAREERINEKMRRLETELEQAKQRSQVLHKDLSELEDRFADLQVRQDQLSEGIVETQSELGRLSQEIAEARRAWERNEERSEKLFKALMVAAAGLIVGAAAASAWQASGGMAAGIAAGESAAAGSSISVGIQLTGGELIVGITAGGVATTAIVIAESAKEKKSPKSQLQNSGTQQNRLFEAPPAPASLPPFSGMVPLPRHGQPLLSSQSTPKSSISLDTRISQPAPKENKSLQKKTGLHPQPLIPKGDLFYFPRKRRLESCLREWTIFPSKLYFQEPELFTKMASFFADSEKLEREIFFGVGHILKDETRQVSRIIQLKDETGKVSPIIQKVYSDGLKRCAIKREHQSFLPEDGAQGHIVNKNHHQYGPPPALTLDTIIESIKQNLHFQENRIRRRLVSGRVHIGIIEAVGLMTGIQAVGNAADSLLPRVQYFLRTQDPDWHASTIPDLYQAAILVELALKAAGSPSHALHAIDHELSSLATKGFNAIGLTEHNKENKSLQEKIVSEPVVQKVFIDALKRCTVQQESPHLHTGSHESQSSLSTDIGQGIVMHKIHHRYGKPPALTLETVIESIKQEFHSQNNPIRDHLISGTAHVGIAEALGFAIKSKIPGYWLMLGTHAVGEAADNLLPRVQHFLDTEDPDWHASAVPDELKGECIDLYQAAIIAKIGLQAAKWPSHALHAIHHELTDFAVKGFNALGVTDHNIRAIFEYMGKQISENDGCWK